MKLRSILLACAASLITAVVVSQAQVPGVNSALNTVFTLAYDNSTMKQTYSSAGISVQSQAGVGATDVCALSGSATKNVRVRRIIVGGVMTAVETIPIAIIKRSAAPAAGAGTQPTIVPYDSSNAAATGVVEVWTANPTVGTVVGMLADVHVAFPNATTGIANGAYTYTFGQLGQPIVLRGVAQSATVNFNNTLVHTGTVTCTFEWTEE